MRTSAGKLQRGRAHSSAEIAQPRKLAGKSTAASTGPRSFERGNNARKYENHEHNKLQRGRAHSSAEIRRLDPAHRSLRPASTGPRSFERGNVSGFIAAPTLALAASTGPRSFERGNRPLDFPQSIVPRGFNGAALIRARKCRCCLSHNQRFPPASTGPRSFERGNTHARARRRRAQPLLQRGRAHSSAEMPPARRLWARDPIGFNGAALIRARKSRQRPDPPRHCSGASTGPRSFERGNELPHCMAKSRTTRFNGAALIRARKLSSPESTTTAVGGFNGAALIRARK